MTAPMMTVPEIAFLLYCYTSADPHPEIDKPGVLATVHGLVRQDILQAVPRDPDRWVPTRFGTRIVHGLLRIRRLLAETRRNTKKPPPANLAFATYTCTVCGKPAHDCVKLDDAGDVVDPRCWWHLPE